jgi:protein-S-isoprenylcysteine O-methyltransferase Ste14
MQEAAMAPLPDSDPAAAVGFFIVLALFAAGEELLIIRTLVRHEGTRTDRGTHLASAGGVVVGVGGAFALAASIRAASLGDVRWAAYAVGLALMVAGLALRWWSIRTLGRSFTVDVRIRVGQTVVDSGPYRWVRRPSYTGLLLICIGVGLALGNGAAPACAILIPLAGLIARAAG